MAPDKTQARHGAASMALTILCVWAVLFLVITALAVLAGIREHRRFLRSLSAAARYRLAESDRRFRRSARRMA